MTKKLQEQSQKAEKSREERVRFKTLSVELK